MRDKWQCSDYYMEINNYNKVMNISTSTLSYGGMIHICIYMEFSKFTLLLIYNYLPKDNGKYLSFQI